MIAANVAAQLKKLGYASISVSEADDMVDGSVDINDRVSIQVPEVGRSLAVVHQRGEEFTFHPLRQSIKALLPDLEAALTIDKADQALLAVEPKTAAPRP